MADKLYTLSVQKLVCVNQEDWLGYDTVRIRLDADGKQDVKHTVFAISEKKSKNTRTFAALEVKFAKTAAIVIQELDVEGDDWIGGKYFTSQSPTGTQTLHFLNKSKSAHYDVTATITEVGVPGPGPIVVKSHLKVAQEALAKFKAEMPKGKWKNITAQQLAWALAGRVVADPANPDQVYIPPSVGQYVPSDTLVVGKIPFQGDAELCGPAAIVFELWRRRPDRYVEWVIELFTKGSFNGRTEVISAGDDLRDADLPEWSWESDWILMASLLDWANTFFDYDAADDSGITLHYAMETWCREILFMKKTHWISTWFHGESDALHKGLETIQQHNGVAFILCSKALVYKTPSAWTLIPRHWVTLIGKVPGHNLAKKIPITWWLDTVVYYFRVQSWGLIIDVRRLEGDLEGDTFGVLRAWDEDLVA